MVPDALHAALEGHFVLFQHAHEESGIERCDGDPATHGSGTDDGDAVHPARVHTLERRMPGGVALGEELMPKRTRLARQAHLLEDRPLPPQGLLEGQRRGFLHGLDRRQDRRSALAGLACVRRRLLHFGFAAGRHAARAQQRFRTPQRAGVVHGAGLQVAVGHGVHEVQGQRFFGGHPFARAHHADGARQPDHARQALRPARTRNESQRDFGKSDDGAGAGDAGIATQREFEAAAQCGAVQRSDDRLAAVFHRGDDGRQLRLLQRLAEFPQVRTRDEGAPRADDHAGLQRRIGCQCMDGVQQAAAHGERAGIDGRVVDDDDQHVTLAFRSDAIVHQDCS
ncbi:hypothetical protein GCM10028813_19830 [Ramlibacter alkalitolerans]